MLLLATLSPLGFELYTKCHWLFLIQSDSIYCRTVQACTAQCEAFTRVIWMLVLLGRTWTFGLTQVHAKAVVAPTWKKLIGVRASHSFHYILHPGKKPRVAFAQTYGVRLPQRLTSHAVHIPSVWQAGTYMH